MDSVEWLQANRFGSFAMGSADRIPRRKYHSLLTIREPGIGDPLSVLAEVAESVTIGDQTYLLHNVNYGEVIHPKGFQHLNASSFYPRPYWKYRVENVNIERYVELDSEKDTVRIGYRVSGVQVPVRIHLQPLVTCRPYHNLTRENPFLDGAIQGERSGVSIQPYATTPRLYMSVSGVESSFKSAGRWDRRVFYSIEQERGYDATEDYYCPGAFVIQLSPSSEDAVFTLHFGERDSTPAEEPKRLKRKFSMPALKRSASQYLITKKDGSQSIIAGYPWFEDWDRDTMISLPGLCLSTGNLEAAERILQTYARKAMKQLIPHAPVVAGQPRNIMVDAPLLFIRAVQMYGEQVGAKGISSLMPAVFHILNSFKRGHDSRVEVTADGGLFVKHGQYAATWMDVVWDGKPLTPRTGFAVDLNALFYNAMCFAAEWANTYKDSTFSNEWNPLIERAKVAFLKRFWSESRGYLADVHDGVSPDWSLRPNQLWATALPHSPVSQAMAKKIVGNVRDQLVTPVGLRTLAPTDPAYKKSYRGGAASRDFAYHQGTVWPWLVGIYADSLLKVYGLDAAKADLMPLIDRLGVHYATEGCLGHIAEVFDADEPRLPGGTPAQAWSLGEVIRVYAMISGGEES